jgi:hypothetical protein
MRRYIGQYFFFEKKKQKTFIKGCRAGLHPAKAGPGYAGGIALGVGNAST